MDFITESRRNCTAVKDIERFTSFDGITKNKRESDLENKGGFEVRICEPLVENNAGLDAGFDTITDSASDVANELCGKTNPFSDDSDQDSDASAASKNIFKATKTANDEDGVSAASKDILDFDLGVFEDVCEVVAQLVVHVDEGEETEDDNDYINNNNHDTDDDSDVSTSLEEAERLRRVDYPFV